MASPYAGNDAFPVTVDLIDDSDPPNAANFGAANEGALDRTKNLSLRLLGELANFNGGSYVSWAFTPSVRPVWDVCNGRWLAGDSGNKKVKASYDGATYSDVGSALSAAPTSITVRPSDGVTFVVKASNNTVAILDPVPDTWTETTLSNWDAAGIQGGDYFVGGTRFILWESRPSNQARLYTSVDLATDVDCTSQLPANFGHNGATIYPIIGAQSATVFVLFVGRPGYTSYVSSTDGTTWTTRTTPTLLTNEYVTGVAYDSSALAFYIMLTDGTTESRVFKSTTGIGSWTLVSTFAHVSAGLAAANAGKVCALATTMSARSKNRPLISLDGGVTWLFCRLAPAPSGGAFFYSSGAQLIYADSTEFAVGQVIAAPPPLTF